MPGGRPRKYPDKAAAKAADRLRAVERKAANTGNLDNAHSDDDYSNRLSDVFIGFSGDFGDDFHSRTGEVDDGEANIIDNTGSPLLSSETISDNASSSSPTPSQHEVHISRSAQHLIDQLTYPHTCSREHHALLLQNHLHKVRNHRYTNPKCSSVDDLQQLVDPTLPHNSYIPDVLSRN
ncbi:hypothetical protein V500_01581, partial [Pseudogymnoascus sp. VKM F-4518 (FW-2643)]